MMAREGDEAVAAAQRSPAYLRYETNGQAPVDAAPYEKAREAEAREAINRFQREGCRIEYDPEPQSYIVTQPDGRRFQHTNMDDAHLAVTARMCEILRTEGPFAPLSGWAAL